MNSLSYTHTVNSYKHVYIQQNHHQTVFNSPRMSLPA